MKAEERIKVLKKYNLVLKQKTRLTNVYTFLLKNRVNFETRKKFKTVRNIIDIVYKERMYNYLKY